jgi:hypothetical protein
MEKFIAICYTSMNYSLKIVWITYIYSQCLTLHAEKVSPTYDKSVIIIFYLNISRDKSYFTVKVLKYTHYPLGCSLHRSLL